MHELRSGAVTRRGTWLAGYFLIHSFACGGSDATDLSTSAGAGGAGGASVTSAGTGGGTSGGRGGSAGVAGGDTAGSGGTSSGTAGTAGASGGSGGKSGNDGGPGPDASISGAGGNAAGSGGAATGGAGSGGAGTGGTRSDASVADAMDAGAADVRPAEASTQETRLACLEKCERANPSGASTAALNANNCCGGACASSCSVAGCFGMAGLFGQPFVKVTCQSCAIAPWRNGTCGAGCTGECKTYMDCASACL